MVYRVCSQQKDAVTKVITIYSRKDGMSTVFEILHKDYTKQPAPLSFTWGTSQNNRSFNFISVYYSKVKMTLEDFKEYSCSIGTYSKEFKVLKGAPYICENLISKVKEEYGLNVGVFNMEVNVDINVADFNILYELCKK